VPRIWRAYLYILNKEVRNRPDAAFNISPT
jgi:hypothetical protein